MSLSTISALPAAPDRRNMAQFDERADAFLSAMVVMQQELDNWIAEFNAEGATYDQKFYNSDSRLTLIEGEVDAARGGASSLAERLAELADGVSGLVLSQEALSTSDISVQRLRSPTPGDDGFPRGMFWLFDDNFWICTSVAPAHARWRRSDGTILRRLDTPQLSAQGSAATYGDVEVELAGLDTDADSIQWEFTGSPTVIDGAQVGSLQQTITLEWPDAGLYTVRARAVGDNVTRWTSDFAAEVTVLVGPSIYCGSGVYCGDGSYPGMMLV